VSAKDEALGQLATDFEEYLSVRGIGFSSSERLDLLAAALGAQFVLFAGPSGTGKSTAAAALSEFFATRWTRLEVPRGLQRQEEFLGYYSQYAERYIETPALVDLLPLGAPLTPSSPPFCVIEEANLSPMEGYLAAMIHGFSGIVAPSVDFQLHREASSVQTSLAVPIPTVLRVGPFPRFLGTVNVDPTAPAPANKITGRSCVVLLEPPSLDGSLSATDALSVEETAELAGAGAVAVGRPDLAFNRLVEEAAWQPLQLELRTMAEVVSDGAGRNHVTSRDVNRAALYMSYFFLLARAAGVTEADARGIAAENALLHFVLPLLPAHVFGRTLTKVAETGALREDGLLIGRVQRLQAAAEDAGFGVPPDYWTSLT
jgi:hypothetical protein